MTKNKRIITGVFLLIFFITTTACYFPEIISSDDYIETQVADQLDEILEETAEAEPTYTPYPTYTPQPTYTAIPYYYYNDYNNIGPQQPGGGPIPPRW